MSKNLTLALSDHIKKEMEKFPDTNWSDVVRKGIGDYIKKREIADKLRGLNLTQLELEDRVRVMLDES